MLVASNFRTQTALDDYSIQYANSLEDYIALQVFSPFYVGKSTFKWYAYTKENLRNVALDAPSGTEANHGEWDAYTLESTAKEYAHKSLVLEKDARDFDRAVADLRKDAAEFNMSRLMVALEVAAHTKATTQANYNAALTSALAAGTYWSVAGGDPLADTKTAQLAVKGRCGKEPMHAAMGYTAWHHLRTHPSILEAVKYRDGGGLPSKQQVAAYLGLQDIYVSRAVYNSANQGAADSLSAIWGSNVLFFVKEDSQRLRSLTYGRCFMPTSGFYNRTLEAPELGRGLGAEWLESGWEYALEFAAQESNSDGDAIAGYLLRTVHA